jgi:conjugal transfer mating pair stabilization protein TraG
MSFDYWTFGNAAVVIQLFNMVAAMVSPASGIVGAAKVMGMIAFLTVVVGAALRADPKPLIQWFVGLAMGWFILFVPKVTMLVIDRAPSGTESAVAVGGVPLGLGFVASSASKLSHWLTGIAETTFSLPDAVAFTNTGLFTPQRLVLSTRDYTMRWSTLESDWNQFFYNCTWYDINVYGGRLGLSGFPTNDELANTADPITVLGKTNKKLFVTLVTGGEATYTCDEAYAHLKSLTEGLADGSATRLFYAKQAFPNYTDADALTAYDAAMGAATQLMFDTPLATSAVIKNQWLINLLRDYDGNAAAATQNPADAMASLMATQNFNQRISSYLQSARAAQDTIPMLRNILEAVAIGLFPVMLLMMILMGLMGLRLLAEWAMFFVSLQLWGFCYALLNFVVVAKTSGNVYSIASNVSGLSTSVTTGFFSLSNSNSITEEITADMAMAGSMAWAIPVICYGLVRGLGSASMAMASSVTGSGKLSAETSGAKAGVGDYSMGTSRFDEVRAPGTQTIGNNLGMSTIAGGNLAAFQAFQSSAPASVSSNLTNSAALQVAASSSEQLASQQATAADHLRQSVVGQAVNSALTASNTSSIDKQWQSQGLGSFEQGRSSMQSVVQDIQSATGANQDVATNLAVNTGLGGGAFGAKLGAAIDKKYGASALASWKETDTGSNRVQSDEAAKFVQQLSSSQAARDSVSGGSTQSKAWNAAMTESEALRESSSASFQKAKSLNQLSSQALNGSASLGFDVVASNPQVAQAVAKTVQSEEFKQLGREGNTMGQRAMVVDALSTQGVTMDALKDLSNIPEAATVNTPSRMPDGSAAPANLQGQYNDASTQLQSTGQEAVQSHFASGAPVVAVGAPDTTAMRGTVEAGQGGIQHSLQDGHSAVTQQSRELSATASGYLPQMTHGTLSAPQSQVLQASKLAGEDATNTVQGVAGFTTQAIEDLRTAMMHKPAQETPPAETQPMGH